MIAHRAAGTLAGMPRVLLPLLVVVALLGAACSGSDDPEAAAEGGEQAASQGTGEATTSTSAAAGTGSVPAPPEGADPYLPPDPLPSGDPGELVWAEELADTPDGVRAWRVLYHSVAVDGSDVAVSGLVAAPDGPAPPEGRPVLSWAHGTTGIADVCAPSRSGLRTVPQVAELVADGYVVAATDYEGLGTPGVHPYLVGESQARSVLDAARVAAELPTGASNETLLWGYSQGGHAAMWAAQLAPGHAPELEVLGVVGGAPPSDFARTAGAFESPLVAGFAVMIGYGWDAAYPAADLEPLLTPEALALLEVVEQSCVSEVITRYASVGDVFEGDPFTQEPWPSLLEENGLGGLPVDVPVLLVQGTADALVPLPATGAYAAELCAQGVDVELRTYEGADHTAASVDSAGDAVAWLGDRVEGRPTSPTC